MLPAKATRACLGSWSGWSPPAAAACMSLRNSTKWGFGTNYSMFHAGRAENAQDEGKTVADTLGETLRSLNEKAHDVADAAKRAVGLESEEEAKPAETRTGDYPSAPAGAEMQNKPHYDPEMEEDLHGKGP